MGLLLCAAVDFSNQITRLHPEFSQLSFLFFWHFSVISCITHKAIFNTKVDLYTVEVLKVGYRA